MSAVAAAIENRLRDGVEPARRWSEDYREVYRLARWLVEDRCFSGRDLIGYLDKPWNWTTEYEEMLASEMPATVLIDNLPVLGGEG